MSNAEKIQLERQAEIDAGYDYKFERRWGRFERGIWLGFVLIMIFGSLGFLGRGPLNTATRALSDGTLIQYERVVRFKTPTTVNFTVPVVNGMARIEADKTAVQRLGLQQVVPQPTQDFGSDRLGPIQFQVADPNVKTVFLQLSMQPGGIGPVKSNYRLNGQTTVEIHQLILP